MSTPHLNAKSGDYAKTVLMPGDPLRARYIAETFLDDAVEVNAVRSMLGFTGSYNGVPISVQGSGMGVPSMQIYATELAKDYGVDRIVRVGSCGALQDDIDLRDIVVALAAGTDSTVNRTRFGGRDFPAAADWGLLKAVVDTAETREHRTHVGTVFTSDFFYEPEGSDTDRGGTFIMIWQSLGWTPQPAVQVAERVNPHYAPWPAARRHQFCATSRNSARRGQGSVPTTKTGLEYGRRSVRAA